MGNVRMGRNAAASLSDAVCSDTLTLESFFDPAAQAARSNDSLLTLPFGFRREHGTMQEQVFPAACRQQNIPDISTAVFVCAKMAVFAYGDRDDGTAEMQQLKDRCGRGSRRPELLSLIAVCEGGERTVIVVSAPDGARISRGAAWQTRCRVVVGGGAGLSGDG